MPISNYDLIVRVREHPEIWLNSHPFHMNRVVLRRFWGNLAAETKESESILRKRWKHFKDQFRKEYKKQKERNIPDENMPWQYFEPLCFLKADIEEKQQAVHLEGPNQSEDDSDDDIPLKMARRYNEKMRDGRVVRKVAVANPKIDVILKKVKETKAIVDERLTDLHGVNRNDPDFLYLLSLAPSIKRLTEIQKLQLKGKINEWLLQQITLNTYGKEEEFIVGEIKTEDCHE